jgi:uncharacterized membrane protein
VSEWVKKNGFDVDDGYNARQDMGYGRSLLMHASPLHYFPLTPLFMVLLGVILAAVTHLLAQPLPGVGIALSPLVAPFVAALAAVIISRERAAPLAYIAGGVGTLLGADIFNLHTIRQLGTPVA